MSYQRFRPPAGGTQVRVNAVRLTDPAQIAANRQGALTTEQIGRLAHKRHATTGGCLLILLSGIFLLCLGSVLIVLAVQGQLAHSSSGLSLEFVTLLALGGLGWVWFFRARAAQVRFEQNVASGAVLLSIDQAQGEIAWEKEEYVAHIPGHRLTFISGSHKTGSLAPGPYHFYYVREYRLVVSAQPVHTATGMLALPGTLAETGLPGDDQARLAVQQALHSVLGFDRFDLEANRQGSLTNRQLRRLPRRVARKLFIDIQSIEGEIKPTSDSRGEDVTYFYEIGGRRLEVPDSRAQRALVSGMRYRVYYLAEKSRSRLLSIEPLEAPRR